jgi:hypothetical protein
LSPAGFRHTVARWPHSYDFSFGYPAPNSSKASECTATSECCSTCDHHLSISPSRTPDGNGSAGPICSRHRDLRWHESRSEYHILRRMFGMQYAAYHIRSRDDTNTFSCTPNFYVRICWVIEFALHRQRHGAFAFACLGLRVHSSCFWAVTAPPNA